MVSSTFVLVLVATLMPSVLSYPFYVAVIPNARHMGRKLGHEEKGNYTPFGRLFRENDKLWASVCKLAWPGQTSVTVGAVLGDPCCKWTGGTADFVLTEPNLAGTVCGGSATTGAAPAVAPAVFPVPSPPILFARAPAAAPVAVPVASVDKLKLAPAAAPPPVAAPANYTASKPEVLCEAA